MTMNNRAVASAKCTILLNFLPGFLRLSSTIQALPHSLTGVQNWEKKSDSFTIQELPQNLTNEDDGLPYRIKKKWRKSKIIPDVYFLAPKNILKVWYGWKRVYLGTKMMPEKVRDKPTLSWPTEKGVLYTLLMTGPDFPTREQPMEREWIYWRVGNIPENDIVLGDEIDAYAGPSCAFEPLPRRFVFTVYKQPIKNECIKFEEITKRTVIFHERAHFSTRRFAEKYGFDIYPHAGNFFLVDGIRVNT